jgi:hypothetical protein
MDYPDLSVTVSFDLSWSNHILKITKKANSMLFLLNKVFCKSSSAIFAKLYKTHWVIQNDCGQVWQLCTKMYVATVWMR